MTFKTIAQQGFAIAACCCSLFAFAQEQTSDPTKTKLVIEENDIYDAEARKLSEQKAELERLQRDFTFDWNNAATIASNKPIMGEVEDFLKTIDDQSKLSEQDQAILGHVFYQIGTYYTHVSHQPEDAIDRLNTAATLLTSKEALTWCYNQLAYAYEQKYARERLPADKESALYYSDKVIASFAPNTKNKEVAFAYCIKGLTLQDDRDFAQAEDNLKHALAIYEDLPQGKDAQYIRTKNRLADTLLEQNNNDKQALLMLEQAKQYWQSQKNLGQNPYAARNLISLASAYLNEGKAQDAQAMIKQAITIIENVYGARSVQLVKPYELLSAAYKKAGDEKLANAYQQKATTLTKNTG
jgi:hypothetical protein